MVNGSGDLVLGICNLGLHVNRLLPVLPESLEGTLKNLW